MPKLYVIKNNFEFRRAYSRGKSYVDRLLVTYVFRKKHGGVRVGVTSGRKIGCAVQRNRARRVIRAAFRELDLPLSGSYDIIFVARSTTAGAGMKKVRDAMRSQLVTAGVALPPEDGRKDGE